MLIMLVCMFRSTPYAQQFARYHHLCVTGLRLARLLDSFILTLVSNIMLQGAARLRPELLSLISHFFPHG